MEWPYKKKQDIVLDTTAVSYSDVFDYPKMNGANQIEIKCDVTAGDWSINFVVEVSDDNITRFEVDNSWFSISWIWQWGLLIDAQWVYMRLKIDYVHNSANTELAVFTLIR